MNKNEVKKQIEDHVRAIKELALINKLPFFFSMAIENKDEKTEYLKEVLTPTLTGTKLNDDQIRKHVLVAAGFEPVPPRENVVFDVDDFF